MSEQLDKEFESLLEESRALSWKEFGRSITMYLPGMIRCGSETGLYPAVSISGGKCLLNCDHCMGKVLEPMIEAKDEETLLDVCRRIKERNNIGVLLSGGSGLDGKVGWDRYTDIIRRIKDETGLHISIHTGILDKDTAYSLKSAGVDQALTDVIGSDDTLREVYHLDCGVKKIDETLNALCEAGITIVPHIVAGIHYGEFRGEYNAIEIVK
ncbi:MAG: radical SAM protein, partial [Candidatus Schekmanbacteria bacterium]